MVLLIVVPGVFLQAPAQRHGPGNEQQVRRQDHQGHRDKEPHHHLQRLPQSHRQVIGKSQQDQAQYRQDPVGLGGLLPRVLPPEQGHGVREPHSKQIHQENQEENDPKGLGRIPGNIKIEGQPEVRPLVDHRQQPRLGAAPRNTPPNRQRKYTVSVSKNMVTPTWPLPMPRTL